MFLTKYEPKSNTLLTDLRFLGYAERRGGVVMKTAGVIAVMGLWIYSVFAWAQWRLGARAREAKFARSTEWICVQIYLKLSGLAVLGWLILMIG